MAVASVCERDLRSGIESNQKRIYGFDLDDSVFWREVGIRYFGHAKNLLLRPSFPKQTLDEIPHYDHTPYDRKSSLTDHISRGWHSRRTAIFGVAELINEINEIIDQTEDPEKKPEVWGITGRPCSKAWYEMTQAQLMEANIKLTGIRMKPKGISGILSKAESIRDLGVTDFYEDDKRTILYLAKLFPNVRFNYIDHGLAPLTEKDLEGIGNITVGPIREFCSVEKKEESAVRNSDLRKQTDFVNPATESLQSRFSGIKAWQVTALGVAFSIAGIEVAEHQNRTGKHSLKTTALAVALGLTGATIDLLDGKWARAARDKMTDEKAREKDEMIGQGEDPFADGVIEAWQSGSAFFTARKRGDRSGQIWALRRLVTTNLPRTAKAIAGIWGFKVPETYKIKDVLHGDIRFFGTSLGRKIPNHGATLCDSIDGKALQKPEDIVAVSAGAAVAVGRLWRLFTPEGELALDDKEIEHAKFRAVVLGAESLAFLGIAGYLGKKLLLPKHQSRKHDHTR